MGLRSQVRRCAAGFTLIEVVAALVLLGLTAVMAIGFFHQTAFITEQLNGRVTAAIIGEGILEEILAGSETGISGLFPEPNIGFSWFSSEETMDDGFTMVTVTVEWRDGNVPAQQISLAGYAGPS